MSLETKKLQPNFFAEDKTLVIGSDELSTNSGAKC